MSGILCWRPSAFLIGLMLSWAAAPVFAAPPSANVQQLLREERTLNDRCRGGSGDDPATQAACARRDQVVKKLAQAGMCYGPPDLPMYQQKWGTCPAVADDAVHFDRAVAMRNERLAEYSIAADGCMHDGAKALLFRGVKSRSQIVDQVYGMCGGTMVRVLQSEGGLSEADAQAGVRAMAGRAVRDVLAVYETK